jgi:nickel-dependent lactate racemase
VGWKVHDPTDEGACAYLAATTGGERIYLAREVTDADFVLSIGHLAYDSVLGYRGTNSVFFPGLSTSDAFARTLGQGHHELRPDDDRPLRQLIDEVAWLLGTQFSLQVVPAAHAGAARALAGAGDSVYRHGKRLHDKLWMVRLEARPDVVVAAIDVDAAGHGWEQIGATLATARNLVSRGGKIVLLSELAAEPDEGLELVRACDNPRDAIQPLRSQSPRDLVAATQLAGAVDWADVYLLSKLASDLVEELFMVPLETPAEAARLLAGQETCLFLDSAQHTYGEIRDSD